MNQLYYIFILFGLLFILEKKAINILTSYVGMILSVALILPTIKNITLETLEKIDGEYISYILILVQVSALTILFGFIIMLFPNLSHSSPKNNKPNGKETKSYLNRKTIFITGILILLVVILVYNTQIVLEIYNYIFTPFNYGLDISKDIYFNWNILKEENIFGNLKEYYLQEDTNLLRNIGKSLYTNDNSILKLIMITTILLLAIISLFFIIPL